MNAELIRVLQSLLDEAVESGLECGCQLAIYQDGELIADLAAGFTSPERKNPVTPETLFPVFSVGKAIAVTAIHCLVEKGTLSYSTRLGDVWPEFDCNGKEHILLWHVLTHRAALFRDPEYAAPEEMADWQKMCGRIAAMRPEWTPGTRCQYHPHTFAWLLGEPASRADGRSFQEIVSAEVIRPLHLENELFFGTTGEADLRLASLDCSRVGNYEYDRLMNIPAIRHGFIPSFNGVMTARAIARHYAALEREIEGVRLLRPETLANAAITRRADNDPVNPEACWPRFGLGYVTFGPEDDLSALIGHGGAAGAEGLLDRRRHIALGFTKSKIDPKHPEHPLRDRIARILNLPVRHW